MANSGPTSHNLGREKLLNQRVYFIDTNLTLDDDDCANAIYIVTAADKTITLPPTKAGLRITFLLASGGLSSGTGLSISPNANDAINGGGLTSVDNKDLILAGAGDAEGDSVTLVGDGSDGWYIESYVGTWSKEA